MPPASTSKGRDEPTRLYDYTISRHAGALQTEDSLARTDGCAYTTDTDGTYTPYDDPIFIAKIVMEVMKTMWPQQCHQL
jgi:hypothetical protein